ncbi:DUF1801 domain-containing protein [Parvicella tangerina]|uniref:YdhG-like domain-containing protein n=1 Tax=Parvicella tangerina TaxID=2829795 RepID=A0A916JMP5_9FLAO|nr:DUF1801 domain-containing protein [Parvicella tangerina]CAG5082183.1 hypothetical protein CRYO30217_01830 [Parvicella tangerina]
MKSNAVDQYILRQKGAIRIMMEILNDFLTSPELELSSTLKYGLPFYASDKQAICYLHKCKDGTLDITFWNGKSLFHQFKQLQLRDRKRMASLNYAKPEEMNLELIRDIANETKSSRT